MRYLVSVGQAHNIIDAGPRFDIETATGRWEILEGVTGVVLPLNLQSAYVTQEEAEGVARKYPQLYRIHYR